jgi:hypothetical protein
MSDEEDRRDVRSLVKRLEPVMLRRIVTASRLSPETLPDELLLLESVIVLRNELGDWPDRR